VGKLPNTRWIKRLDAVGITYAIFPTDPTVLVSPIEQSIFGSH